MVFKKMRQIRSRFRFLKPEELENRRLLTGDTVSSLTPDEVDARIESFKSYFVQTIEASDAKYTEHSESAGVNGVLLYNLQYVVDGALSMYEATGDREILAYANKYVDNVMRSARHIEGGVHERDGHLDWEWTSGGQPRNQGILLYDLQFGSAMSRLARIIHEDARLQDDIELQAWGDDLIEFIDEQIVFKWLDSRNQRDWLEGFYDNSDTWTDKATHMVSLCDNVQAVLGDSSSCGGIERTLAQQFKDILVVADDGAYLWGLWDTLPSGHHHLAPDTAHENRVATMVAQLGPNDVVFGMEDIELLANTFVQRIWNGRTDWEASPHIEDSPWFYNYIDGSDELYRNYVHHTGGAEGMSGFVYDGWVRLGEFVPEAQVAGEALLSFLQGVTSNVNAIRSRNGTDLGIMSLTGHLARNLRNADYFSSDATDPVVASAATANDVLGDIDGDGVVGFSDFVILSNNFGNQDQTRQDGDLDGDQAVTFSDFLILAANF